MFLYKRLKVRPAHFILIKFPDRIDQFGFSSEFYTFLSIFESYFKCHAVASVNIIIEITLRPFSFLYLISSILIILFLAFSATSGSIFTSY